MIKSFLSIPVPLQTALSTGLPSISSSKHDVDNEAVAAGRGVFGLCSFKYVPTGLSIALFPNKKQLPSL